MLTVLDSLDARTRALVLSCRPTGYGSRFKPGRRLFDDTVRHLYGTETNLDIHKVLLYAITVNDHSCGKLATLLRTLGKGHVLDFGRELIDYAIAQYPNMLSELLRAIDWTPEVARRFPSLVPDLLRLFMLPHTKRDIGSQTMLQLINLANLPDLLALQTHVSQETDKRHHKHEFAYTSHYRCVIHVWVTWTTLPRVVFDSSDISMAIVMRMFKLGGQIREFGFCSDKLCHLQQQQRLKSITTPCICPRLSINPHRCWHCLLYKLASGPWTTHVHRFYPCAFQQQVLQLLLIRHRLCNQAQHEPHHSAVVRGLPMELLLIIAEHLHYFIAK